MDHIIIRNAVEKDVCEIEKVMNEVSSQLADRTLYVTGDRAYIQNHISEQGFTVLAVCGERVAGFLIVHLPGETPDNLGYDAGLPREEIPYVGHMDSAAVREEYRGHGIQRMMMMEGEIQLKRRGYRYAMATVSPDNPYSLENCRKLGYQTAAAKRKYGGLLRLIVMKNL